MTTLTRTLLVACATLVFGASVAYAQPNHSRHGDQRPNAHQSQGKSHHTGQRPHNKPPKHAYQPQGKPHHYGQRPHTKPPKHAYRPAHSAYRPGHAHGARPPAYRPPPRHAHRGAGPNRNWYQGSRLPPAYRTHHYVVNDWRGHRLHAPARGQYWVQNGADYLLVAIATGVIVQIVLSN